MASSEENFNATIANLLASIPSNMEENLRVLNTVISGPGGPKTPIITNDPNDPRLKSYQDSLKLYNQGVNLKSNIENSGKYNNTPEHERLRIIKNGKRKIFPFGDVEGTGFYTSYMKNTGPSYNIEDNKQIQPIDNLIYTRKESGYPNRESARRDIENKTVKDVSWLGFGVQQYKNPVQPVVYEEAKSIIPGETIPTMVNKPSITDPLIQLETATKILDQLKDGNYSVTFGDPTKTDSQKTKTFANKAAFEAFIEALAAEDNTPRWITRSKNGAQALFTRESTKDKPVGM